MKVKTYHLVFILIFLNTRSLAQGSFQDLILSKKKIFMNEPENLTKLRDHKRDYDVFKLTLNLAKLESDYFCYNPDDRMTVINPVKVRLVIIKANAKLNIRRPYDDTVYAGKYVDLDNKDKSECIHFQIPAQYATNPNYSISFVYKSNLYIPVNEKNGICQKYLGKVENDILVTRTFTKINPLKIARFACSTH
jgi:hypothetical protein